MHEAHVRQRPPRVPHAAGLVPAWQTPATSQQPLVHVVSHVSVMPPSTPPSAREQSPAWHDSRGWQMTQLSPPRPQACTVVVTMHSLLRQQPEQFPGPHGVWHRPAMHCRFCEVQSEHTPPSRPHAFVTLPARQTPF